ncbi:RNA polymerase sigma factor [uncultured Chitinophaga sp.]|jgi:RNA polymerase sigma factor, sigma-70 family|uniref:RNA polymerase sigma factor n=1 Tax=uncultured Chitinophaga sp. TaxID=339340 RepID=UPI00260EC8F9|nr:RNA polymerase sigma factor [uncultured Chitinophaga sp.]
MQHVSDDILLVKALVKGDESAFNELFHKYSRWIFLAAISRCNGNVPEAKDVVQEVFFKLWKIRETLKPELSVKSLLFTMMSNTCKDRNEKRQTSLKLNIKYLEKEEQTSLPADSNGNNELAEKVHKAIDQITAPKTRQVIKMYYMDGLSYKEIIHITGMKLQTVRNYVSEGLAILRKNVKNQY